MNPLSIVRPNWLITRWSVLNPGAAIVVVPFPTLTILGPPASLPALEHELLKLTVAPFSCEGTTIILALKLSIAPVYVVEVHLFSSHATTLAIVAHSDSRALHITIS